MKISQFISKAEELWPLAGAEDWDRPGLSVGNPRQEISGALIAVDVTAEVLDEAIALGVNLLLTHHPLLLKGVTSISEDTHKGELVAKAITSGIAVYSAHTNADIVEDGVSDTFAKALGLTEIRPLIATGEAKSGHGRIGKLSSPVTVSELVRILLSILPASTSGVRSTMKPDAMVQTVSLCGGAGDAFITDAYSAGADVYITSDLRHHVADESPIGLIDVSHWAAESLWLKVAAKQLAAATGVEVLVSEIVTDPWNFLERRS